MKAALLVVIAIGVAIGVSMPPRRDAPVTAAPPTMAAPAPTSAPAVAIVPGEPMVSPGGTVLQRDDRGHFIAFAQVNGETIRFVVDTGASVVALTAEDAARAHVAVDPGAFVAVGQGASGEVRGQPVRLASVALDGKQAADVQAVVLPDAHVSLLGQNYLRRLSVSIQGDTMTLR
jgi:aspartyl protease family protein